jgi:hypothetical protein
MTLDWSAEGAMGKVDDYKERAKACRELAAQTIQIDDKVILEEIARAWDKVAVLREWDLRQADES